MNIVEYFLIAAIVELQERIIDSEDLEDEFIVDMCDRIICTAGLGPDDWEMSINSK